MVTTLFVYGTLRSECNHAAYQLITEGFTLLGKARVKGKLYNLGDFPGAVKTKVNSFIEGELYELKEGRKLDQAFVRLDEYEGLPAREGEQQLYVREIAEAIYNHSIIKAWIYWYNQDVSQYLELQSGNYLEYMTYNTEL